MDSTAVTQYCYRKYMSDDFPFHLERIDQSTINRSLHSHNYFQIVYVRKGALVHCTKEANHTSPKGALYLLHPSAVHYMEPLEHVEMEGIQIDFMPFLLTKDEKSQSQEAIPFISSPLEAPDRSISFACLPVDKQQRVEDSLDQIWQEWEEKQDGYQILIRLELLKLLILLEREMKWSSSGTSSRSTIEDYRILKAIHYMQRHFNKNTTLEHLGDVANMSAAYFSHRFRSVVGKTVTEYMMELRISHAMKLLRETSCSITEISLESGFNHLGHFNKIFKKVAGVPPTVYRKWLGSD